ncbi:MAG TPA: class I SAM-dependent methyltransferase [Candidatus Sulfotelmatobacter sp.]|nr:class I SAM-dependent methyltransferase [Candidatus Sulfotelmatobacter sp.]
MTPERLAEKIQDADPRLTSLQAFTGEYYREYAARKGANRNSLLRNPEVLFQILAQEAAMVRALRSVHLDTRSARILDVGCGEGDSLWLLLRLGFPPVNLFGVDLLEDRIRMAKETNPLVSVECEDATRLHFQSDSFDLVTETMMFLQLTDDDTAKRIASEMIRVTKPAGILLVSDWRYSKPGSREFKGVSRKRLNNLYEIGKRTEVCGVFRGALVPPLGRFLSKNFPSAYFMIQALFPFATAHVVTTLRKIGES